MAVDLDLSIADFPFRVLPEPIQPPFQVLVDENRKLVHTLSNERRGTQPYRVSSNKYSLQNVIIKSI